VTPSEGTPFPLASPMDGAPRPPAADAPPFGRSASALRRRLRADRLATLVVTAGGVGIVASILAILVFIVAEVLPLIYPARVETAAELPLAGGAARALDADPYRTHVAALGADGVLRVISLGNGSVVAEKSILPAGAALAQADASQADVFAASTEDGRVILTSLDWHADFATGSRKVTASIGESRVLQLDAGGKALRAFAARLVDDRGPVAVGQLADGSLATVAVVREENAFTGAVTESEERTRSEPVAPLSALVLDDAGRNLFGGDAEGRLLWWRLADGKLSEPQIRAGEAPGVSALALLIGGRSLVVGRESGALETWSLVPDRDLGSALTRIHALPGFAETVTRIVPSWRDKGFFASSRSGDLGLFHSTSEQLLWQDRAPLPDVSAIAYSPRGDTVYVAGGGELAVLDVDNPHPEISLGTLFSRVWYEGYPEPTYVWQSSSGSDDFEPKLSLVPLLVGTLKGTLYSLLIAIPLGVFGAMYVANFMAPRLKQIVKPTIEIMAALPSVVLGFLAGLWLAPRLEQLFPALLLMILLFPVLVIGAGIAWDRVPARLRSKLPVGVEALFFILVLAVGILLSILASGPIERLAFGGDFQAWLLGTTGLPYDQRNAIVVGLAMGFAVIPIIFAISEDAFANVPASLVSGSLALGANRWQTVTQIVLPTASPGIFSAVMVGFGRAVGETMIVLMATGNTPILDWNPFNGFRTLSANIAVEIPEAPQFGTLYRVLFLAALLLFALTFVLNTVAEVVRQRLRRRYAEL